jgi:hypothetical protein
MPSCPMFCEFMALSKESVLFSKSSLNTGHVCHCFLSPVPNQASQQLAALSPCKSDPEFWEKLSWQRTQLEEKE